MNKFTFDVKQLKMWKFIKPIWQLIISTLSVILEVTLQRPLKLCFQFDASKETEKIFL